MKQPERRHLDGINAKAFKSISVFVKRNFYSALRLLAQSCRQDDCVTLMKNKLDISEQALYPYLKITAEKFPRLLVTRKIENDKAEYFGAFLPETGVRFFINFLNKLFKLRTCTIEVDGSFDVPCPQFYARRCLAPCVENLCGEKEYLESVELLRLLLERRKDVLREKILDKINFFAENFDFESAAQWRDKLSEIENFWKKNEWILWLDEATDSWETARRGDETFLFLVTTRGRKNLGKRVFAFDKKFFAAEIYENFLFEFYRFHAPSEIRVSDDFPSRKIFSDALSKRENRKVKIIVTNEGNRKKTIDRAVRKNKHEFDLKNIKPPVSAEDLRKELKKFFNLNQTPKRIEAFDVAHISGANPVGANAVWENGKFAPDKYGFWFFDEMSELETLENSISERFSKKENLPDLLLIDGGSSQLNAALKALENFGRKNFFVISAVKPPGKHAEISHFLTETGEKILFENDSDAFRFLQRLRDEAHAAANSVHRTSRDFAHFYEPASILPSVNEKTRREILRKSGSISALKNFSFEKLKTEFDLQTAETVWKDLQNYNLNGEQKIMPPIVPIRYDDPNGDAQNLQPLQK